jgi:hypothetical protein
MRRSESAQGRREVPLPARSHHAAERLGGGPHASSGNQDAASAAKPRFARHADVSWVNSAGQSAVNVGRKLDLTRIS